MRFPSELLVDHAEFFEAENPFQEKDQDQMSGGSLPVPLHQSHFSQPRAPSQKPLPSQRLHFTEVDG